MEIPFSDCNSNLSSFHGFAPPEQLAYLKEIKVAGGVVMAMLSWGCNHGDVIMVMLSRGCCHGRVVMAMLFLCVVGSYSRSTISIEAVADHFQCNELVTKPLSPQTHCCWPFQLLQVHVCI